MFSPTVFHIHWNTPVEPVKWTPASDGCLSAASPTVGPWPLTRLMTPGGSPAASSTSRRIADEVIAVCAGFQTQVLPMIAGATGRLAPMAVKLNGVTQKTKPSSGLSSIAFQKPGGDIGCSAYSLA